jgi:hypothetical protein
VHREVKALGSTAASMQGRAVAVNEIGAYAHGGFYHGQLLRGEPPGTPVGLPATAHTGGFIEIFHPLLNGHYVYTFVSDTLVPENVGSAYIAALAADPHHAQDYLSHESYFFGAGWHRNHIMWNSLTSNQPLPLAITPETRDVLVVRAKAPWGAPNWPNWTPHVIGSGFHGPGDDEARAIAMGPRCGRFQGDLPCKAWLTREVLAVGGVFQFDLQVRSETPTQPGIILNVPQPPPPAINHSLGGFVVLMLEHDLGVFGALGLASLAGNVEVNAVAIDREYNVYVAGSFSTQHVDFNPQGSTPFGPQLYWGGTELFVAKYILHVDAGTGDYEALRLEWLHTLPRIGASAATALAVAPDGTLYAAGYVPDDQAATMSGGEPSPPDALPCSPPPPKRNIWLARFDPRPLPAPYHNPPTWYHVIGGHEDEAALGIALDAWHRPVITGFFGIPRCNKAPVSYSLDFNPSTSQQFILTTAGGYDSFVARYNWDGTFHEAFRTGGDWNEVGSAIAVRPMDDFGIYQAGYFGHPFAPGVDGSNQFQYQVDFDPGPSAALAGTYGGADAFLNIIEPAAPASATIHLSIVIDGSTNGTVEWAIVRESYLDAISDPAIIPPAAGSVAVNIVFFSQTAHIVVPSTLVTSDTLPMFIAAFEAARPATFHGSTVPHLGVAVAAESMRTSGTDSCWRIMHVIMRREPPWWFGWEAVEEARDAALTPDPSGFHVNQINGLGMLPEVPRWRLIEHLIGSSAPGSVAFAAEVDANWPSIPAFLRERVELFLRRETRCPGDFNRDGYVDANDLSQFTAALAAHEIYADWNFDGLFNGDDLDAFNDSWAVPCPCP